MFGSIIMVIWQGAVDVSAGRMSGGTIAAFILYGGLLAGAFGALSEVYGDLLRAAGAATLRGADAAGAARSGATGAADSTEWVEGVSDLAAGLSDGG